MPVGQDAAAQLQEEVHELRARCREAAREADWAARRRSGASQRCLAVDTGQVFACCALLRALCACPDASLQPC